MTSLPTTQHIWVLAEHLADGPVTDKTFRLESRPLPELKPNQALVRLDYLSNDPAFRYRIRPGAALGLPLGQSPSVGAVATILKSTGKWKEGQHVLGQFGWYDYAVVDDDVIKTEAAELPGKPWTSISPLGISALTAYQGIVDVLEVGPETTLLVDAAAGSVGSCAIQIARNRGAKKIVGIAGGQDKCDWVVDVLGADECVDYKAPDFEDRLAKALPNGADRYLDMVGARVFDLSLKAMAQHGIIGVIGAVSTYNGNNYGSVNHVELAARRLTVKVFDYLDQAPHAYAQIAAWIKNGTYSAEGQHVVDGTIEQVPTIWQGLFDGANKGKLITRLEHKA